MQIKKVNKPANKGVIGYMLDHLFTYYPEDQDITKGEPVYNSVLDQVNEARDSALDMKKRFNQINIGNDPQSTEQMLKDLKQLQSEANRFRRVAQAPDQKPAFWRYILHPGSIGPRRDQVTTDQLDKRRLQASNIRDDMELINSQAGILEDIALETGNLNYDLKSFGVKTTPAELMSEIQRHLDIMIGTLNKTSRDLTQASKSMKTIKQLDSVKTSIEEKATVDAALRYYKAMKETMQDVVVTTSSTVKWWGSDNNPEGIELPELDAMIESNAQASPQARELTPDIVEQINPEAYEQYGQQVVQVGQEAEQLYNDFQEQPDPEQLEVASQLQQRIDHLNDLGQRYEQQEQFLPGDPAPKQTFEALDQMSDIMANVADPSSYPYLGTYTGLSNDPSGYRSYSVKKANLKEAKNKIGKLAGLLKNLGGKFKRKKAPAQQLKKKAKLAKKALELRNK